MMSCTIRRNHDTFMCVSTGAYYDRWHLDPFASYYIVLSYRRSADTGCKVQGSFLECMPICIINMKHKYRNSFLLLLTTFDISMYAQQELCDPQRRPRLE